MNYKSLSAMLSLICLLAVMVSPALAAESNRPMAHISAPDYEFEEILDGSKVLHDFIIQNRGRAELEITKVRTG